MTQTTTPKIPLSQRINFRVIIFAAVVLFIVGYPAWVYIDSEMSGGIHDRGSYKEVDLKSMSTFAFDPVIGRDEDVPKQWRALDGQRIVVQGEIAPTTFTTRAPNEFDLVYSVQNCCLTGTPQVQHFVESRLVDGRPPPDFSAARQVVVEGILHVKVKRDAGIVSNIYSLDVENIKPAL